MVIKYKKGQVTIFVIVAILIVGAIVVFLALKGNFIVNEIPAEFQPVYNSYSECISDELSRGADLLGSQGGRIGYGDIEQGSSYSPFGSHLDFFGSPIGYWYHLSANGVIKENVPTKKDMEKELGNLLDEKINDCNLDDYYKQGFYIDLGNVKSEVKINSDSIDIVVNSDVVVSKGNDSATKSEYKVSVRSKLGSLYDEAIKVYNKEKSDAFLEDYAVDTLRLYAPVDGVKVSCGPEVWKTQKVVNDVLNGLESNFAEIKFKGNYYDISKNNEYFVVDESVDAPVRFMYSRDWPSKVEINGDGVDDALIIAQPVGNQEGLGIMGFCYVPYHYVYDVSFPVMVQIGDGLDLFQFPITVIVDKNLPRKANLTALSYETPEFNLCDFKEGSVNVYTYDANLNPVGANVSYECLDQTCYLGESKIKNNDAVLNASIPHCIGGNLVARAEGYADSKVEFSSNSESIADIILDKVYDVNVNLVGRSLENENAIVYFTSGKKTITALLPDNPKVSLKEGSYNISVYIYGNSQITIPASSKTQCFKVSSGGISGIFGATKDKCVNINVPESKIDNVLVGGGKTSTYILNSELQGGIINLEVSSLPVPSSLKDLQINYELFDSKGVGIFFG